MGTQFFCLCMSPALDATVRLPAAPKGEGEIFKDVSEAENVGGKAVNVARWLALRGAKVMCGGLLAEIGIGVAAVVAILTEEDDNGQENNGVDA